MEFMWRLFAYWWLVSRASLELRHGLQGNLLLLGRDKPAGERHGLRSSDGPTRLRVHDIIVPCIPDRIVKLSMRWI